MTNRNKYEDPITIAEAIGNIDSRRYLLPGIQRHFVWDTERIERLFDSIMRDYPINTFMLWHITDPGIKESYRFYDFICDFKESRSGGTTNQIHNKAGQSDFDAVIDGQQRLTSLYIGLLGSYTVHMKNKSWDKTTSFTKRRLYLNLMKEAEPNEDGLVYDFKFREPSADDETLVDGNYWFPVGRILSIAGLGENGDTDDYATEHNLPKEAKKPLNKLYKVICSDLSIVCYRQNDQDADKVLDIFTRTNSGGVPLNKSDLIMAIATSNWQDIREKTETLVQDVWENTGFAISGDFILKSFLVVYSPGDIRFKVGNFGRPQVEKLREHWDELAGVISNTFLFLKNQNFSDDLFRAKYAAIPLIYYFQKTGLYQSAAKTTFSADITADIVRWLTISFLKGIFGGQTDALLKRLHDIIEQHGDARHFPFKEIVAEFRGTNRNYAVDDDLLDQILDYRYGKQETKYVLRLLQGVVDPGLIYEQDHLHPKSVFLDEKKLRETFTDEKDFEFAKDKANWDSIANLQLLEKISNINKSDMSLVEWASKPNTSTNFYVPEGTSLELKDFRVFIEERRNAIRKMIREAVAL